MRNSIDFIFEHATRLIALLVLFIVAWIFTVLFQNALASIDAFGLSFITDTKWAPNLEKFGALPAIVGSVLSTFLAMIMSIPIAMASDNCRGCTTNN